MSDRATHEQVARHLRDFISDARWFGGKGREWRLVSVRRVGELPVAPEGVRVAVEIAELQYDDGPGEVELYQVPLVFYPELHERLAHALVGEWDDEELGRVFVYDALHDREAMGLYLRAFASGDSAGPLTFHRVGEHELDLEAHSTLFPGEQSNSSVAFGEDAMLKVFRKVTPGMNPDIAIHRVLTESGSDHVAALYGWVDTVDPDADTETDDVTVQLAMLQQFLRTASDGWELALSSVRNLFTEADLHADEVGGDFAGEAARLGAALAEVHDTLAAQFPTETLDAEAVGRLAAAMHGRLDDALDVVPGLAAHESALRATFDRLRGLGTVEVQQVHGDLHLGQTLRTSKGWKFLDFEGEPAKPLAERMLPDSPWRDVAGMLRSFDYAPRVVALTSMSADPGAESEQQAYRAGEWAERNRSAFLAAYVQAHPLTDEEDALLQAYVADKAVYEAVYETRNRPGWEGIPLDALARITDARDDSGSDS